MFSNLLVFVSPNLNVNFSNSISTIIIMIFKFRLKDLRRIKFLTKAPMESIS